MSKIAEVFDPGPYGLLPGFKERSTSKDAARAVARLAGSLREHVFEVVRASGARGRTPDEAASLLGKAVLAVRPRFSELKELGWIEPTGERRRNESGLMAKAWRATTEARITCGD